MWEYIDEILPSARLTDIEILLVVGEHEGNADKIQAKYGYLANLAVPMGCSLSVEGVEDGCPAWSYGRAQKNSRAKYKIYHPWQHEKRLSCAVRFCYYWCTNLRGGAVNDSI